MGKEFLAP